MQTHTKYLGLFLGIGCLCLAAVLAYYFAITKTYPLAMGEEVNIYARRGQFGDMFGAVTAVFAALAFAGALVALLMQASQFRSQAEAQSRADTLFQKQADAIAIGSEMVGVSARLHRYDQQIKDVGEGGAVTDMLDNGDGQRIRRDDLVARMIRERHNLTIRLDAALRKSVV